LWCQATASWLKVGCAHGSIEWVPLRCRRCEGCRLWRQALVMARIRHGLEVGQDAALLTLTSLPGTTVPQMMAAWNRMRGWLRKQCPDVDYAAVKQFGGRSGMLHLHVVLLNWSYVSQAEISRRWQSYSGAWHADIRRVSSERPASYVTGYVARELARTDCRKVVTYSAGFPRLPARESRWRWLGEQVVGVPAGRFVGVMGGCLVVRSAGCECVESMREVGLDGHLFLRRLERGPP